MPGRQSSSSGHPGLPWGIWKGRLPAQGEVGEVGRVGGVGCMFLQKAEQERSLSAFSGEATSEVPMTGRSL